MERREGRFHQETKGTSRLADTKGLSLDSFSGQGMYRAIGCYDAAVQKVEKLKLLCLQYAAASQWLISSSIDIPKLEEPSDVSFRREQSKQWRSRSPSQALKMTTQNTTVTESILKFEREFSAEHESLGPILSSNSQSEPYLTHLAVDSWGQKRPIKS